MSALKEVSEGQLSEINNSNIKLANATKVIERLQNTKNSLDKNMQTMNETTRIGE